MSQFKTKYQFHEKLKQANKMEPKVLGLLKDNYKEFKHAELAPHTKGGADILCMKSNNYLAEIKIDFTDYNNHFIERYSDMERKKQGGPWQYNFVKYYIFYYPKSDKLHIFDPKALTTFIEQIPQIDKIWGKKVFQRGAQYTTFGYAIPKIILNHLELKLK